MSRIPTEGALAFVDMFVLLARAANEPSAFAVVIVSPFKLSKALVTLAYIEGKGELNEAILKVLPTPGCLEYIRHLESMYEYCYKLWRRTVLLWPLSWLWQKGCSYLP